MSNSGLYRLQPLQSVRPAFLLRWLLHGGLFLSRIAWSWNFRVSRQDPFHLDFPLPQSRVSSKPRFGKETVFLPGGFNATLCLPFAVF